MFIYYGKTFESSRAGGCIVGVVCDNCGGTYYYELARIGTGAYTAHYGFGSSTASQNAQERSEIDLQRRLALEAELVPWPRCHWINDELVDGYRLGRYRGAGPLAFVVGFAGSILSLVVAWFIYVGTPQDRWLLPYVALGGPVAFLGMALTLLLLRRWLRSRIQPNRQFPHEPELPLGTPPALVKDESTGDLQPAVRASAPGDAFLDYQCGRHVLPPLCCECLQPAEKDRGYSIHVTRLVHVEIPRCADCARKCNREWRRLSFIFAVFGLLVGSAMVLLMARASAELWIILVCPLILVGATAVLTSVVATARTAPAKVIGRDRSRGIVRLQFRNPDYVPVVSPQLSFLDSPL